MPIKDDNAAPAGGVDPATHQLETYENGFRRKVNLSTGVSMDYWVTPGEGRFKFDCWDKDDKPADPIYMTALQLTEHRRRFDETRRSLERPAAIQAPFKPSPFPGIDQYGEPIGAVDEDESEDEASGLKSDAFAELGYSLPHDDHPSMRKTSSRKAKVRDDELHMKTVAELARLDIGFMMNIDAKAGKVTLRRSGCQTVIYLTHKSRWLLAGRNKTMHGTVAEFAHWYRNNIAV